MESWKFSIKILEVNVGNFILDKSNWDKIGEGIIKQSISGTEWDSLLEV